MKSKGTVKKHYPLKISKYSRKITSKLVMVHNLEEKEREIYEKEVKVIKCIFGGLIWRNEKCQ